MVKKQSIEGALATVVEEAVVKFEGDDAANAIAFVVQETGVGDRKQVLQAVADGLDSDDFSRLEKRELVLMRLAREREKHKRRVGAGLLIATRRH